mmetsp:Transcript_17793/g.26998  ORF Transcript_17793/g.26998 Transcript_17793/m.26998 type:complete len:197 (-) Transcript_17793:602-1192(-)
MHLSINYSYCNYTQVVCSKCCILYDGKLVMIGPYGIYRQYLSYHDFFESLSRLLFSHQPSVQVQSSHRNNHAIINCSTASSALNSTMVGVSTADEGSCMESGVFTISDDDTIATVEDLGNEDTKRTLPKMKKFSTPNTVSTIYEESISTRFECYQNSSTSGHSFSSYSYNFSSSSSSNQDSSLKKKVTVQLHKSKP